MVCFDEFWNEKVILDLWREVIDPKDSAFFKKTESCGFIFFHMISVRGHFKDAWSTLSEDRNRFFSPVKYSASALCLSLRTLQDPGALSEPQMPNQGKKKNQTIFSAHLWSEDNTGPEAHIVKQFQS